MSSNQEVLKTVLESLERARESWAVSVQADTTTLSTDDQDCYPRGLQLRIDRKDPKWRALLVLSKQLDWVNLNAQKQYLQIKHDEPLEFRKTQHGYLEAIARSLSADGIECYPDVNWH